jgi:hypothetical protein
LTADSGPPSNMASNEIETIGWTGADSTGLPPGWPHFNGWERAERTDVNGKTIRRPKGVLKAPAGRQRLTSLQMRRSSPCGTSCRISTSTGRLISQRPDHNDESGLGETTATNFNGLRIRRSYPALCDSTGDRPVSADRRSGDSLATELTTSAKRLSPIGPRALPCLRAGRPRRDTFQTSRQPTSEYSPRQT